MSSSSKAPPSKKRRKAASPDKNNKGKIEKPSIDINNTTKKTGHEKMAATLPLQNRLLRDLECPVCIEPMVEKIVQCADGHNICKECKDKVHNLLSQIQGGLFMKRLDMELW